MRATELRKKLYRTLSELERNPRAVEVLRHGRPLAVLVPAQAKEKRRPDIPLDAISKFCAKHRLAGFHLFGSILTDAFGPGSDVDVMVDTSGRESLSFDEHCQMLDELEAIFGRRVDMLTKTTVESMTNAYVRDSILRGAALVHRHV